MKTIICGIDPGLKGGIAFYDPEHKTCLVLDMPIRKTGKKTKRGKPQIELDAEKLSDLFTYWGKDTLFAVVEDVKSRPKQGVASTFKFGFVTGIVHGVLAANRTPVYKIAPAIWKSLLGLSKDKKESIELARKTFRNSKIKKDGIAEAALLAKFGADRLLKRHMELVNAKEMLE